MNPTYLPTSRIVRPLRQTAYRNDQSSTVVGSSLARVHASRHAARRRGTATRRRIPDRLPARRATAQGVRRGVPTGFAHARNVGPQTGVSKYELVMNHKPAKAIGPTIRPSLSKRADEVTQ